MAKVKVRSHKRGKKKVKGYSRDKRPKGKKKLVGKKVYKYNLVRDEFGRTIGLKRAKGKK